MKLISNPKRAFTLLELLAVITIIAVLAALTVGLYSAVRDKTVESTILAEMEQVKLALQSYKEKDRDLNFPPSGPAGNNKLYYYLSGEAELERYFKSLPLLRPPTPNPPPTLEDIKTARMTEGIKNLLPNLKEEQFNAATGSLYSPLPDKNDPLKRAPWIYERDNATHNRETYDLSVKIWDIQKDKDGVLQLVLVKEIGNW
jgi:prepilin-type N-terminal cleavage/methylation domain-containing protein